MRFILAKGFVAGNSRVSRGSSNAVASMTRRLGFPAPEPLSSQLLVFGVDSGCSRQESLSLQLLVFVTDSGCLQQRMLAQRFVAGNSRVSRGSSNAVASMTRRLWFPTFETLRSQLLGFVRDGGCAHEGNLRTPLPQRELVKIKPWMLYSLFVEAVFFQDILHLRVDFAGDGQFLGVPCPAFAHRIAASPHVDAGCSLHGAPGIDATHHPRGGVYGHMIVD
jgi:hypothetical protein